MASDRLAPGYGTLGVPAQGNAPGARDGAATWTDGSGNFWLFGGEGDDVNGNYGSLNDLWEFNPSKQEWTWVGGNSTVPASCAANATYLCGHPGVYGVSGAAGTPNIPGSRSYPSYWTDRSGNFWLFGGFGVDAAEQPGDLNDLWEFHPATKEWTWMGGSNTVGAAGGQAGVYGALDISAPANMPGGRDTSTSWIDRNGRLWIYGGEGFDGQGNFGYLDDLWEFDPATGRWTWMGGNSAVPSGCLSVDGNSLSCGWPAVYGAFGVSSRSASPGSRLGATGWTDRDGNLWLFGGLGASVLGDTAFATIDQYDLWKLIPSTRQWVWVGGNSASGLLCGESSSDGSCAQNGVYGAQGVPAVANIPTSRDGASACADSNGNLWLFGGEQPYVTYGFGTSVCNDIWVFEPAANEWAFLSPFEYSPSNNCGSTYSYGVLGVAVGANGPQGRSGAATWADSSGNLWVFGGSGPAISAGGIIPYLGSLNDFWVYRPVAPPPQPSFELIASPNPINIGIGGRTSGMTTATTTVGIVAGDGFDSPVTLTVSSGTYLSTGASTAAITGSFSPATISGSDSSTLTISVGGPSLFPSPQAVAITATSGGISQSIWVMVDITQLGQVNAPVFSVPAGMYTSPQTVAIAGSDFIYYTTDGSTPTASSAVYVNPITITSTTTLQALVIDSSTNQSAVSTATYLISQDCRHPIPLGTDIKQPLCHPR